MAVRYSFILIPDPSFLRLIHTSRQILCNQFGCWTAEMFMIHVPLINFFQSTPEEIESDKGLINQIVSWHSDGLDGNYGDAEPECCLNVLGDRQEGTHSKKEGKSQILDEHRFNNNTDMF